jgi:hypothetical protein
VLVYSGKQLAIELPLRPNYISAPSVDFGLEPTPLLRGQRVARYYIRFRVVVG